MAAAWCDTFFGGLYTDVLGHHGSEEVNEAEARLVKRLLKAKKGSRVLDVGCGMGRLTLPLARMGLNMMGIDLTARYIRRARRATDAANLDIQFAECDMRQLPFEGEFDAAFLWFTSFGYFSPRDNIAALREIRKALKPGGRLLSDVSNKTWILSHFRPCDELDVAGVHVVDKRRYDPRTGRMYSTWTLSKGKRTETHKVSLQMFNGAELRAALREAGFRDITLYGNRPLGRFTRHSMRLIAVAVKPKGLLIERLF